MKEQLKEAIMQTIASWDESEITEAFVEILIDIVENCMNQVLYKRHLDVKYLYLFMNLNTITR